VTVNGTNGNDIIDVFGAGTSVSVVGLPTLVNITNSEGANDSLVINALLDCRATALNSNVAFSVRLYALPESDSVTAQASPASLAASPESLSA